MSSRKHELASAFHPLQTSAGGTSADSIEIAGSLDVKLDAHSARGKAAMSFARVLPARFCRCAGAWGALRQECHHGTLSRCDSEIATREWPVWIADRIRGMRLAKQVAQGSVLLSPTSADQLYFSDASAAVGNPLGSLLAICIT